MKLIYLIVIFFNDFKIVMGCFLKFIFKGQISDFFSMPKFSNRRTELLFFWVYLMDTYFIQSQDRRNLKLKKKLRKDLEKKLIKQTKDLPKSTPIPIFLPEEIITEAQIKELLAEKSPFIIKGLFSGSTAVKHWTLDYFVKNYGEMSVLCGDPKSNVDTFQQLKNVQKDNVYVRNVESLFFRDPNLAQQIELERFQKHHLDKNSWLHSVQLFLASSTKAKSAYHNTKVDNFFVMINGKKKWWFVNPTYTHAMEPFFNQGMAYYESKVGHPEDLNPDCSLYQHVPILEGEIEPGDFLFSPSLWWHAVQNTTPENIGIATRWYSDQMETYYPLSLIQIFNPRFISIKLRFMKDVFTHLRKYRGFVNFHQDRNYASIFDEKKQRTLFEHASHQVDYQTSLKTNNSDV